MLLKSPDLGKSLARSLLPEGPGRRLFEGLGGPVGLINSSALTVAAADGLVLLRGGLKPPAPSLLGPSSRAVAEGNSEVELLAPTIPSVALAATSSKLSCVFEGGALAVLDAGGHDLPRFSGVRGGDGGSGLSPGCLGRDPRRSRIVFLNSVS